MFFLQIKFLKVQMSEICAIRPNIEQNLLVVGFVVDIYFDALLF